MSVLIYQVEVAYDIIMFIDVSGTVEMSRKDFTPKEYFT
jgi:hypothetical protein